MRMRAISARIGCSGRSVRNPVSMVAATAKRTYMACIDHRRALPKLGNLTREDAAIGNHLYAHAPGLIFFWGRREMHSETQQLATPGGRITRVATPLPGPYHQRCGHSSRPLAS